MTQLLAAQRDASFWPSPGTNGGKYHVVVTVPADDQQCDVAACSQNPWYHGGWGSVRGQLILLDERTPAEQVPEVLRCRRPGCRRRWPTQPTQETNDHVRV